jgi:hypothetical protein
MGFRYPKKVIAGVGIAAVLLAATVLLSGYANSRVAEEPVITCQAQGGCCPMTAQTVSCPKVAAAEMASIDGSVTTCSTGCPKPCCAGEGCDNPCPIPCPKPCCADDAPKGCCTAAGSTGCPLSAAQATTE